MRKAYAKPEIIFESFVLSQSIAGDCEIKTHTPAEGECAYVMENEFFGPINVFVAEVHACTDPNQEGYNGVCYHTFEANSIFNS